MSPLPTTRPILLLVACAVFAMAQPQFNSAQPARIIARLPTSFGVPTNVTTYEPSLAALAQALPPGAGITVVDAKALQPADAAALLEHHAWTGFFRVVPAAASLREQGTRLGLSAVVLCKVSGDMAETKGTCYLVPIPSGEILETTEPWDPRMRRDSADVLGELLGRLLTRYMSGRPRTGNG